MQMERMQRIIDKNPDLNVFQHIKNYIKRVKCSQADWKGIEFQSMIWKLNGDILNNPSS